MTQNVEEGNSDRDNDKGEQGNDNDGKDTSSDGGNLDEERLENQKTWELAKESGAMLINEEDDIMAILQEQNEEIAQKKKSGKTEG
ncbi:hypothetical protein AHAS_Ahas11G0291400 [Arachis hypogaea]